jgi:invasion protein IalB
VKTIVNFTVYLALAVFGWSACALAQQAPKKNQPNVAQPAQVPAAAQGGDTAPATSPPQPGWISRCTSVSRDVPLECAVEETAVLSKTGQLIVLVNIRVAGDTHAAIALVQLPLGLNLPAGAKLQVDDGKVLDLQIQTCENRGCYANAAVTPDLLTALKSGKQLKVSFQNLAKETITIPMPLSDFAAAYDKIK